MRRYTQLIILVSLISRTSFASGIDQKTSVTISDARRQIDASLAKLGKYRTQTKDDVSDVVTAAIDEIEQHWVERFSTGDSKLNDWVSKKEAAKQKAFETLLSKIPLDWHEDIRRALLTKQLAGLLERVNKATEIGDFQTATAIEKTVKSLKEKIDSIPKNWQNDDPFAIVGHWVPAKSPNQNGVRFDRDGTFVNIGFEDWNGAWSWCPQGYYVLIQKDGGQVTHWQFQEGRLYRWGNLISKNKDRKIDEWVPVK